VTASSVRAFSVSKGRAFRGSEEKAFGSSEEKAFSVSEGRASDFSEGLLALGVQELHLWFCPIHTIASSDQFKREVLSHYAPMAPVDWCFVQGKNGKPRLGSPPRPLDFNLSHSGDWLVCAVTAGSAVGVDLEICDPQRDVMKLARRFFLAAEIAALQACPLEQQLEHFYDYWTLKEARIKCRGAALGQALEATGFQLGGAYAEADESGLMRIAQDPPDNDSSAHYCLLQPLPGYRLATCWLLPQHVSIPSLHMYQLHGHEGGNSAPLAERLLAVSAPITAFDTSRSKSC
jgi:phosphopantetheine--protein transferase-like protein